jgi:ATP-dependent RNA helicase DDX43
LIVLFFICYRKENNNIVVDYVFGSGGNAIPNPVQTFEQAFRPYPEILEEIYKQNFEVPSPIQSQGWPILLKGCDLIGIAQTGTGKTLSQLNFYCFKSIVLGFYIVAFNDGY